MQFLQIRQASEPNNQSPFIIRASDKELYTDRSYAVSHSAVEYKNSWLLGLFKYVFQLLMCRISLRGGQPITAK